MIKQAIEGLTLSMYNIERRLHERDNSEEVIEEILPQQQPQNNHHTAVACQGINREVAP